MTGAGQLPGTLHTTSPYLFRSARLGFRGWREADAEAMAAINANPDVMRYFPDTATPEVALEQAHRFIELMRREHTERGHCYWAVDHLKQGGLIGFIGLHWIEHAVPRAPFVDIGWRLAPSAWGRGLATEGAAACLGDGFGRLKMGEIYAMAPRANRPSIRVMQKIGMSQLESFVHPLLVDCPELRECVLYRRGQARD